MRSRWALRPAGAIREASSPTWTARRKRPEPSVDGRVPGNGPSGAGKRMSACPRNRTSGVDEGSSARGHKRTSALCGLVDFFDVRKLPCFVEESLGGRIGAEHEFETAPGVSWHPVRLLTGWRCRSEVDVHRAVGVLLHLGNLR